VTESQHILILLRYLRRGVQAMKRAAPWSEIECEIGGACARLDYMLGVLQYDCNRDTRRARPLYPRVLTSEMVYAARLIRRRRFIPARQVLIRVLRTVEDHSAGESTRRTRAVRRTAKMMRGGV
jgi:hypothetical protein